MSDIKSELELCRSETCGFLSGLLTPPEPELTALYEPMRYSALSPGKMIRPFLVRSFSRLFGGDDGAALPFMAAIELVHASSLVHDDIMDDDDTRRGRPTSHVLYGVNTAILCGDALITKGYQTAADNPYVTPEAARRAVSLLLDCAGAEGMMGGQSIDGEAETHETDFDTLIKMHDKKTGALIRASALLGCCAAGIISKDDERALAARTYASGIGLAFQITDDILDATGNAEVLGKPVHSDARRNKTTFLSFMSVAEASEYAKRETDRAAEAVSIYPGSGTLREFAFYLLGRNK